ncbi:proton-conducting transporter membrane subunit [Alkalimonas delamerensis]|uniref:Proton-conducting transporter membrane subunit n=1 Tax=Alkalimonas delamerensis TaxID=265981 RepID=A0ABT9GLY7_9GAMM|nr:proton-conducting transporter membrane subunit [Alkalimonas delamerensis]MDP4527815.1 proton-conducting transporter membrane subunit [Alkalimonas delamerensis]
MSQVLVALALPLLAAVLALYWRRQAAWLVWLAALLNLPLLAVALWQVVTSGSQPLLLSSIETELLHWQLTPLTALLMLLVASIHFLVASYSLSQWRFAGLSLYFWPLAALVQSLFFVLLLSADLLFWYLSLELLGLVAVALVLLGGKKAWQAALRYLLLSLAGSLCFLLGVALLYTQYGSFALSELTLGIVESSADPRLALWLMTLGLMLKAALWPLHWWLPAAHLVAPAAVSALHAGLIIKAPLFLLWMLWSQLATPAIAEVGSVWFLLTGSLALLAGGWSALRAPLPKLMIAHSTVAQLGYGLLALGLMLSLADPALEQAFWLFVMAHGLAKAAAFLAIGEMQLRLGGKRLTTFRGASQTMPLAMFALAVAGGSLIGLPPSGGFLAKWQLLVPLWQQSQYWPVLLVILLGTLLSAGYVFRLVVLAFYRARPRPAGFKAPVLPQWLALMPALLVWGLALFSLPLLHWLGG